MKKIKSIKKFREALGISQSELGRQLGIYQSIISQWENELFLPNAKNEKLMIAFAKKKGFKLEL